MWAYERTAARYAVIRQSLGAPDPFKLNYQIRMRELISTIIIGGMDSKAASKLIRVRPAKLPEDEQASFVEAVDTEILALHEGNFARYRVAIARLF